MRARWWIGLGLLAGCTAGNGGGDDTEVGGGVITFVVDGTTYTESSDVGAITSAGFMGITWNALGTGDLGSEFYGSLTISSGYTGAGTYAPMKRSSDVDAVIEVGGDVTYYPLGNNGNGDGSLVVDSADADGAEGTFSFTGDRLDADDPQPITGTFDVTFTPQDTDD